MKDFPILGPTSEYAARVGIVAEGHGKYQIYYHAIESEHSPINNGDILECAGFAGLNVSETQREVNETWVNDELLKDQALANSLGLDGTPDFIIGKTLIEGVTDKSQLTELLQKEESEN